MTQIISSSCSTHSKRNDYSFDGGLGVEETRNFVRVVVSLVKFPYNPRHRLLPRRAMRADPPTTRWRGQFSAAYSSPSLSRLISSAWRFLMRGRQRSRPCRERPPNSASFLSHLYSGTRVTFNSHAGTYILPKVCGPSRDRSGRLESCQVIFHVP